MILGLGIDLVEIDRFQEKVGNWDRGYREKIFTLQELEYSNAPNPAVEAAHLAVRFAAKEAWIKASGIAIEWTEIEVRMEGRVPRLVVHGKTREEADRHQIGAIHLSLTHSKRTAGATVILEKIEPV